MSFNPVKTLVELRPANSRYRQPVGLHVYVRAISEDSTILECITCDAKGTTEYLEAVPCKEKDTRPAGW